jgi:hypothetical protein
MRNSSCSQSGPQFEGSSSPYFRMINWLLDRDIMYTPRAVQHRPLSTCAACSRRRPDFSAMNLILAGGKCVAELLAETPRSPTAQRPAPALGERRSSLRPQCASSVNEDLNVERCSAFRRPRDRAGSRRPRQNCSIAPDRVNPGSPIPCDRPPMSGPCSPYHRGCSSMRHGKAAALWPPSRPPGRYCRAVLRS